ncbi:N-acetylmuramoyl-L-alanine amidase [Flammeovirga pacifica]|nr:N-acetylmuramoyl-L-alanine amidase [Flammeovirga pacifica]
MTVSTTTYGQMDNHKEYSFKRKIVIVIDPGHGGEDVGKPKSHPKSYLKNEADLNLDIALRLGGYLEERVKNVDIKYTRKTDRTLTLNERVDFANKVKADYFISIHCNSLKDKNYKGTQVHIQSKKFPTSYALAKSIDSELRRTGRVSKGIRDQNDRGHNLQVLQYSEMPGVLVECGFMSNHEEEKFLNSGKGQTYIASALYRGIRKFENLKTKPAADKRYPYYRVQIGTITDKKELTYKKYRRLNMQIEPVAIQNKYILYVGREYEKKYIDKLLATVKKKGFKDAFIRKFEKPQVQKTAPKKVISPPVQEKKTDTTTVAVQKTDINKGTKEEINPNELHFYRIQIMSSDKKLDLNKNEFTKLGESIYLFYDDSTKNPYKYQVLVGKYYAKSKAQEVREKVRKKGFPDAFIVTVKQSEARKSLDIYIPKNN